MPWKVLEVEFTKRTNLAYDKNQLKNEWDWMRNRWSLWKALKGKENGLGWDHEKGTISASDEWWKKNEENVHFRPFQYEGIEPELEYKMEQLFGGSVAQGGLKFTPVQRPKESVYIPSVSLDDIHSSPPNVVWNDSTPLPSPSPSPQSIEHGIRGSRRSSDNDVVESSKSCRTKSGSRKGGAELLMEKLDAMVKVVTERNTKEMELMSLEAQTLAESSHTLADSLAKLVSMLGLVPGSPEFFFACTMIEDPQKRILLKGMPDDNTRLQWIKYLIEKNG
ncbi:L10-interacting MYB domain-containing protein [Bienertia sinuspersici]